MQFHPDLPPETRKSGNPEENRNRRDIARAKLVARDPSGPQDWARRYDARFRELVTVSEDFREMLDAEPTPDNLVKIQERLDQESH